MARIRGGQVWTPGGVRLVRVVETIPHLTKEERLAELDRWHAQQAADREAERQSNG